MNNTDLVIRAKSYIDKMANGINPITDKAVPDDDFINNVRISRCLFYVSDILNQVIDNGGIVGAKTKTNKVPFSLTREQIAKYEFGSRPETVSGIVEKLNALIDTDYMTKLKISSVTQYLVDNGYLQIFTINDKNKKKPTQKGNDIGIFTSTAHTIRGDFDIVTYDKCAQQFILDNIDSIAELNINKK